MREYLEKKRKGELVTQILDKKYKHHLEKVVLESDESENVIFGKTCCIFSEKTKGFISGDLDTKLNLSKFSKTFEKKGFLTEKDIDEKLHKSVPMFGVTTAQAKNSLLRNTFVIEKVTNKKHMSNWDPSFIQQGEENELHYNQPFLITTLPKFYKSKLYLQSQKKEFGIQSLSNGQRVTLCEDYSYQCVWKAVYRDPKYRLEFEGETVKANHPVIIVHCTTGQNLSTNEQLFLNDFGKECVVECQQKLNIHKLETENQVFHFVKDVQ